MAIEPIGSMMTLQAQPVQRTVEPAAESGSRNNNVAKPANEFTSADMSDAPQVDATTLSVNNVTESDSKNSGNDTETAYAQNNEEFTEKNNERIKKAVSELNKNMDNSIAQFGIHEETNRITIKIVDKDTKKVIKELPPEKTLDMIAKAWELAGLMVDERR